MDALQLPAGLEFRGIQVGARPGEAEDLAVGQAVYQDQDVGGVERVLAGACRVQEAAGFLDGPDGSPRQTVRVWFVGDRPVQGADPFPELMFTLPTYPFRVVSLPTLVRRKLSAFRTIDRVHLQDMVRVGLID